jgi:hypothetical protein
MHSISDAPQALGTGPTDPGDGRGDGMYAEQISHHLGQMLLGQQLAVQQIQHHGVDPLAALHGRDDALGKRHSCRRTSGSAMAAVRSAFGDGQWLRFGWVEHLLGDMARRRRRAQRSAAHRAGRRIMLDDGIWCLGPA